MADRLTNLSKQLVIEEPPIEKYRRMSTIECSQLKELVYGPNFSNRDKVFELIKNNRDIFEHSFLEDHDKKTQRKKSAEQMLFYGRNNIQTYYEHIKNPNAFTCIGNGLYAFDHGLAVKIGVHLSLYSNAIFNLGTKSHQKYLDRSFAFKDIGCFALTEFNHGSNARSIKTEAHFCPNTKSFIIHTPTRQDMKFWIGAAANMANMSVIFAQLYIGQKCYGPHAYIVPIRNPDTHEPYPGVLIGDCGPKNGVNTIDNGFIIFDKYQIPFENQLNRISGVDDQGKFFSTIPNEDKRFSTIVRTLTGGRMVVVSNAPSVSFISLAIAVRYTLARRQFSAPKSFDQILLYEYPLTKYRLMPLLAQTVIFALGGKDLIWTWDNNLHNLLDPKNTIMAEMHAISSATKPVITWFNTQVIQVCRQMLGGHGYSTYSRLGTEYNDSDVNQTWQGDNNVLLQQAAKYILDNARKYSKGKTIQAKTLCFLANVKYMNIQPLIVEELTSENVNNIELLERIFESRVMYKIQEAGTRLVQLINSGKSQYDAWQALQPTYAKPMALAYGIIHNYYSGQLFYFQAARRAIEKCRNSATKIVIEDCLRLFAYRTLINDGYADPDTRKMLEKVLVQFCQKMAKQAVGILDCLAPPPQIIGSPFADQHGQGMKKYYNILFTAKDAFRKVDNYLQIVQRHKKI